MSVLFEKTIYAPATPPINSAIAIIRISGSEAFNIIESIFSKKNEIQPRFAYYGSLIDINSGEERKIIDDVILIFYKSPYSFTGEDMVEIFCHGNQFVVQRIIKLLNNIGLALAEPGEFSKRAFLNGKIDLTEAEAINHVITARNEWEIDAAIKQMHGSLRSVINQIKDKIILLKADIESGIDFSEENIEFISNDQALKSIDEINNLIENLHKRCINGKRLSQGIDVTIAGKPNAGKSSILNIILNQERAIVSNIPGTTRDCIRESFEINGMQVNLIDTAGIDITDNEIEKIGIERSEKNIETSSLVIMVFDASTGICEPDKIIIDKIINKKKIYVINKIDIADIQVIVKMEKDLGEESILFSAKTGQGLDILLSKISNIFKEEFIEYKNLFIADLRVVQLLEKALENVYEVKNLIFHKEPGEIIAFELHSLIDNLSEITGEITPDDVLNSIFSRFCIGK